MNTPTTEKIMIDEVAFDVYIIAIHFINTQIKAFDLNLPEKLSRFINY